jgi:hypothetical protein
MFSKKKQEGASPQEPTYAISNSFAVIKKPIKNEKDNYGDEDRNSEMVNQAGKVGKAQHNFFR